MACMASIRPCTAYVPAVISNCEHRHARGDAQQDIRHGPRRSSPVPDAAWALPSRERAWNRPGRTACEGSASRPDLLLACASP